MTRSSSLAVAVVVASVLCSQVALAWVPLYSCGARWPAQSLPVDYWLNQAGSDNFPLTTTERIMRQSFDTWSEPCCSSFSARYQGLTSDNDSSQQRPVVLTFFEDGWPQQLGDLQTTLGVTRTGVLNNCTIFSAPIYYNGAWNNWAETCQPTSCPFDRTYRDELGRVFRKNQVHLLSVATHEVGHLLGLAHSPIRQATMFASYQDGSGAASLHPDDEEGVCTLYPGQCTCQTMSDCAGPLEDCVNGQCTQVPCMGPADCEDGLVCTNGQCVVPPCTPGSCEDGFRCNTQSQECEAECPVCRACTTNEQCGGNGVCLDFGFGEPRCIIGCDQQGLCPGDAGCFGLRTQQGVIPVCGSPSAGQSDSLCPDTYVCRDPNQPVDPCDACDPMTQDCVNGQCVAKTEPEPDMGRPEPDMSTGQDMAAPADDMGDVRPEPDMGSVGGADMGRGRVILIDDPGEGAGLDESSCAAAPGPRSPAAPFFALVSLLLGLMARRRRG